MDLRTAYRFLALLCRGQQRGLQDYIGGLNGQNLSLVLAVAEYSRAIVRSAHLPLSPASISVTSSVFEAMIEAVRGTHWRNARLLVRRITPRTSHLAPRTSHLSPSLD